VILHIRTGGILKTLTESCALPPRGGAAVVRKLRFSMINKVATTHSFLRRQIKREDISTNAVSVTKTELYTILRDVCIVSRDVCIVSNRLICIDAKLSEMEILAQPLSLPFIIENLTENDIGQAYNREGT
jgi:hypothetical protein